MGQIDAILFDLGDTVINFGIGKAEVRIFFRAGSRATYNYLAGRGKKLPPFEDYYRVHFRAMNRAYIWSLLCCRDFCYSDVLARSAEKLGISLSPAERNELAWRWYQPIADKAHLENGIADMLERLTDSGTKLAIVSNTLVPGHCLDRHLARLGLLRFFPVRIYSSQTRFRKPHRRIFEIALEQLHVRADRACFIGDVPRTDIRGARRAGMKTIFKPSIKSGWRRYAPDATIQSLAELPSVLPVLGWHELHHPESAMPAEAAEPDQEPAPV